MNDDHVRIVVSGSGWMGGGTGSIETALRRLFAGANDEVIIVAYAVSGSITMFFQQISSLLQRGVKVTMIINRYSDQHLLAQEEIQRLLHLYSYIFRLFSFVPSDHNADLHAKILIVDRRYALIGSANLSLRGLKDNHELDVIVEGKAAIEIARKVDQLIISPWVMQILD